MRSRCSITCIPITVLTLLEEMFCAMQTILRGMLVDITSRQFQGRTRFTCAGINKSLINWLRSIRLALRNPSRGTTGNQCRSEGRRGSRPCRSSGARNNESRFMTVFRRDRARLLSVEQETAASPGHYRSTRVLCKEQSVFQGSHRQVELRVSTYAPIFGIIR